ncbi:winged helix DNA-binding domain-containing protein [Myceligenerans indicum]|uniref:Winged helix DNA-binding domain-containing protein n=1 Tax=Myceligenerans indicum TaxID=2593663 RepID=A0ABS1LIG4_9MICO|nr:winged helix DNA-binding domain-containing protein [Myceligenerans indicum]MBL0886030.1 winged helix DNA-binding domain-containing protein [Myceligenerans indicum]
MASPTTISSDTARRLRLRAQRLVPRGDLSPVDVVQHMVALQGQDLPAVLRAIVVRSRPGTTLDDVRAAFDSGRLVRGWTQRGTLFATTPSDLTALLSLTAERVKQKTRKLRADEGIDDDVVRRAAAVAREALADGGMSRASLTDLWEQEGVSTEGQRGYHLIVLLALDGLLHWGPFAGRQQLLVATRRAPSAHPPAAPGGSSPADPTDDPGRELRRIARAYFASHGPATTEDLAWWLGLPKTPVRRAVADISEELREVDVDGTAMLVANGRTAAVPDRTGPAGVTLVPGFDEIVLGYANRDLVASKEAMRQVVPFTNGVFRPAVLLDGRLVGTWRRAPKKGESPYALVDGVRSRDRQAVEKALSAWEHG